MNYILKKIIKIINLKKIKIIYSIPITNIMLFTTHARDPDRAMSIGAISDQELVKGQNLWTKSIPSPSSKTAPP